MMALVPGTPAAWWRICIDPPRPPQKPSDRPMISAIERRTMVAMSSVIGWRRGS